MAKPAEATFGQYSVESVVVLLVLVLQCLFYSRTFGVGDDPLSLHVERA